LPFCLLFVYLVLAALRQKFSRKSGDLYLFIYIYLFIFQIAIKI